MTFSVETLKQAIDGDQKAVERVVKQYTPLVYKMVHKYGFMSEVHSYEDLTQEGLIAIVLALKSFAPPGETTLESWMTWLYWKVRNGVQFAARKEKRNKRCPVEKIMRSGEGLQMIQVVKDSESQGIAESRTENPLETFDYNREPAAPSIRQILIDTCGSLDSRKAKIVCGKFGLLGVPPSKSQSDLAEDLGVTKQCVSNHWRKFTLAVKEQHPNLKQFLQ
jgi:RNA polymerase sigma factor (sigma-70 family)